MAWARSAKIVGASIVEKIGAFVWKIRGKQEVDIEYDRGALEMRAVGAVTKAGRAEFGSRPDGQNRKDEIVKPDSEFVRDRVCALKGIVEMKPRVGGRRSM